MITLKEKIDTYFAVMNAVHESFGYKEDWKVIPLEDGREYYWHLDSKADDDCDARVIFAETPEQFQDAAAGNYYTNEIYSQRFLPKYIYRTDEYTLISVDTHTDGNKFLQIFDNSKELKDLDVEFVKEVLAPFEEPAWWSIQNDAEKEIVKREGGNMGYGRMMQLAQICWREYLIEHNYPPGGEFQHGPCVASTTACGCSGGCDWCGGSGWLTTHVKRIKDKQHA